MVYPVVKIPFDCPKACVFRVSLGDKTSIVKLIGCAFDMLAEHISTDAAVSEPVFAVEGWLVNPPTALL